jgi:small multidrug resistance pump
MLSETFLRRMLRVAAVYNICWGTLVSLFPNLWFDIFAIPHINYPFIMSGLGMCIGLYGYGYWVAAGDLRRYPQMVILGFLGKTIGPLGWAWTVYSTDLPLRTMWTNVFNDFIWLPFFIAYFVWYGRQARAVPTTARS